MVTPMQTQEVVVKLLSNVGSRKEVDQYLQQFTSVEPIRFAVVRITGGVLMRDMDALVSALAFLHNVGLRPVIVHGAGPQLDDALTSAGIHTTRIEGLRVTPPAALDIVKKVLQRENLKLVDALARLGVNARPISTGVLEAESKDAEQLGLVGSVSAVHLEAIQSAISAGALPVVASLGETRSGQILNINAVVATRALSEVLKPYKVIFLNEQGALRDGAGQPVSAINLAEDYAGLLEQPWVTPELRMKLGEIKQILDGLPATSSVSITSPDRLARELFTHKGSGTIIRQGERVNRFDSMAGIDELRLRGLVEKCFGRALKPDYFTVKKFFRVYLAESYRATAVLTNETGIPYLDKFAVTQEAQGVGVGSSIWRRMVAENPRFFWRARRDNPINPWYFEVADGSYKSDRWTVFWVGMKDFDVIKGCIEHALSLPATLVDAPAGR